MKINIKKLRSNAVIPTHGSAGAAGYDLYACLEHSRRNRPGTFAIQPNQTVKIGTGVAVEIPIGYFGAIFARSGLATNHGLRPANCVGIIDADYRGELIVALHNDDNNRTETICDGDRIAQLVVLPYMPIEFNEVGKLSETARDTSGFGSTGIQNKAD